MFNQEIAVPAFLTSDSPGERKLLEKEDIDFNRDVMNVELDIFDDVAFENMTYFVELKDWATTHIEVGFNFSNPLMLSRGDILDKIYLKVKDRSYFITQNGGVPLDIVVSYHPIVVLVPRQFPNWIDE